MTISIVYKLHIANFLTGLIFWYPIEKLFMQQIGIDALGVGAASAVLLTITLLLDVPSGILADKWKRKYVLMIGLASLAGSSLVLGMSTGLPLYLVGTALYGLYIVMSSGTLQAIMYDGLRELGKEHDYDKHQGRSFGFFLTAIAVSSLAGGYIGQYVGLQQTYLVSLIPTVLALIVLASIAEPVYHKEIHDGRLIGHIRKSYKILIANKRVLLLSLLFVTASSLRFIQNDFGGLYYIGLGLAAVGMGTANAGKWLAGAAGQFAAAAIGARRAFNMVPVLFLCFLLFSLMPSIFGLVFYYIAAALFAVIITQTESVLQADIPSSVRATTISLLSFTVSGLMVPVSLLLGFLAREADIFRAYQVLALAGMTFTFLWVVLWRPKRLKQFPDLS